MRTKKIAAMVSVVGAVVAASTLVSPGVAYAASAGVYVQHTPFGDDVRFSDLPDAIPSHLVVRSNATGFVLDHSYGMVASTGCHHPDPADLSLVWCTAAPAGAIFTALLHSGDDFLDYLPTGAYATAGLAALGGNGADTILGGNGVDVLIGGPGDDHLNGWGGSDAVRGQGGADRMYGGSGEDHASYSGHTAGVTASLNGVTGDDGAPGEGDTIGPDIEGIEGSDFDDHLTGNGGPNTLKGCGGRDTLRGLGGDDRLTGEDGRFLVGAVPLPGDTGGWCGPPTLEGDTIDGGTGVDSVSYSDHPRVTVDLDGATGDDGAFGEGDTLLSIENVHGTLHDDTIIGNSLANTIYGQEGDDTIFGMDGNDSLFGYTGNDNLYGGAGADILNGGAGTDFCNLGAGGLTATECAP